MYGPGYILRKGTELRLVGYCAEGVNLAMPIEAIIASAADTRCQPCARATWVERVRRASHWVGRIGEGSLDRTLRHIITKLAEYQRCHTGGMRRGHRGPLRQGIAIAWVG